MIKIRKLTLCLLLTLVLFTVGAVIAGDAFALWYNPNWDYRQMITIDSSQVPGDLTNFPVLISTTDPNLRVSPGGNVGKVNGGDILFTSADGITKLDHEIESYNSTTGELIAWVEVPNVSSTADTVVYMYYGNAGAANQWNINGTWDEGGLNNFVMVQHLEETSGNHIDSTSNGNNGTPQNGVIQNATGQISGADFFDGNNDYIDAGTGGGITGSQVTIEAWINHAGGGSNYNNIFGKGSGPTVSYGMALNFPKRPFMETATTAGGKWGPFGSALSQGIWYYIVGVYDGSNMNMYVDGTLQSGTLSQSGNLIGSALPLTIGRGAIGGGLRYFNGLIDEVRTSNIVRSPDWIETSFNNQSDPSSFLGFGAPVMFTPVPTITEWGMIIFIVLAGIGSIYYLTAVRQV